MPPSSDHGWCVQASLDNAALFLVRDNWIDQEDQRALAQVDPHYHELVTQVPRLRDIDFSALAKPRLGYEDQQEIDHSRVLMLSACAIHYGLDFGLVVRFCNHEYVAHYRDRKRVLRDLAPHIDPNDLEQIDRILFQGCPAKLKYELPREHKIRMLRRGNQKSVSENMDVVRKTLNKEERNSHIIPFLPFLCRFSNVANHVPQGMVIKIGRNPRLVCDGSTHLEPDDIVMNDIIPLEGEAPITFGRTKERFSRHLYNTRVSYPDADIDVTSTDIKAAHRYPRIMPDLSAALGFSSQGRTILSVLQWLLGQRTAKHHENPSAEQLNA